LGWADSGHLATTPGDRPLRGSLAPRAHGQTGFPACLDEEEDHFLMSRRGLLQSRGAVALEEILKQNGRIVLGLAKRVKTKFMLSQ
jgi:hypothetical protein